MKYEQCSINDALQCNLQHDEVSGSILLVDDGDWKKYTID